MNNKFKKSITATLIGSNLCLFCLVGCGNNSQSSPSTQQETNQTSTIKHIDEEYNSEESMKNIAEENKKLYKYSEYLKEKDLSDEVVELFEKYNIHYYDESVVEVFDDMSLPKPETCIANFPSYTKDDNAYLYSFEDELERTAFFDAYLFYLMNSGIEITDMGDYIYMIDGEYYTGIANEDGKYIIIIIQ